MGPTHRRLTPDCPPPAVAVRGQARDGGSDSDESITSPEFRPADQRALPSPGGATAAGAAPLGSAPTSSADTADGVGQRELPFAEQLAAINRQRESAAAHVALQTSELTQLEQAAKQQRRAAAAEGARLAARIAELQAAEGRAVEAEDYERAAALSADQESARSALEACQEEAQAAGAMQRSAAAKRLQLAQEGAAAWDVAVAALAALHARQQLLAAAAGEHAARVTALAGSAEADTRLRIQQLQQQETELLESIMQREGQAGQRQRDQQLELQRRRDELAEGHAALEGEVAALRCVGQPSCAGHVPC